MAKARNSLILTVVSLLALQGAVTLRAQDGKIPITTRSEKAREEFLKGRDLSERLQVRNALPYFEKAIALDPHFALAELNAALVSQTQQPFFDHLKKAVDLAGNASEGEQLLIMNADAGAKGDVAKSRETAEKLAGQYPSDERALIVAGNFWFGQQDFEKAHDLYTKAIALAPNFSPAYNILGYTLKQLGRFEEAKSVFATYTTLIPNDPNPLDSYAELLMTMGDFSSSLTAYRRALAIDPNFFSSSIGVAMDLLYQNDQKGALVELKGLYDRARTDGERRGVLFARCVCYADQGEWDEAVTALQGEYAIAKKAHDVGLMSNDVLAQGAVRVAEGKYREALVLFDSSRALLKASSLSAETKANFLPFFRYNYVSAEVGLKDFARAKKEIALAKNEASKSGNPALVRQSHRVAGILALAQKDYATAAEELKQADQRNPYNLFWQGNAYEGMGDRAKALEFYRKAAWVNPLPQLDFAFVRVQALAKVASGQSTGSVAPSTH